MTDGYERIRQLKEVIANDSFLSKALAITHSAPLLIELIPNKENSLVSEVISHKTLKQIIVLADEYSVRLACDAYYERHTRINREVIQPKPRLTLWLQDKHDDKGDV